MDRTVIANRVATKLFAAERAIDVAMAETAQLVEAMAQGRIEAKLASAAADVSVTRVAEALSALAEARRAVSATHSALANVQQEFGIQVTAAGVQDKTAFASLETANPFRVAG